VCACFIVFMEEDSLNFDNLPKHVAIVMDGSGRWGKYKYNVRNLGHSNGINSIKMVVDECIRLGIPCLTLFAFSKENWERPKEEVDFIIELMHDTIRREVSNLISNNVKLSFIGDISDLPDLFQKTICEVVDVSSSNVGLNLVLAISYSGRWEILQAVKTMLSDGVDPGVVNEDVFNSFMQTKCISYPDLLIRTGGESRISNFFLWQLAYTEIFFSDVLWPDFSLSDFRNSIIFYQKRNRRFGKIVS
jgi:undecaprenyl diphosphate synthase